MNPSPNPQGMAPKSTILRVEALAVIDPIAGDLGPVLLAERVDKLSLAWRVLAVGPAEAVDHHPAASYAQHVDARNAVLIPGLVNAHTHLDLSHIGPQPHDPADGFVPWVDMVRSSRLKEDDQIRQSVARGVELLLAGGTVAAGDIAGSSMGRYSLAPWEALRESPLLGVCYIECFGIGRNQGSSRESLAAFLERNLDGFEERGPGRPRLGLQPHAPNTVAIPHYQWVLDQAERLGAPVCTHLAETPEEREFIARGIGGQRELLERLNIWEDSILEHIGRGLHPVRHLEPVLSRGRMLAAHCNDAPDEAIEVLARTGTSVAYCPRASEYFGVHAHFGPHRYREMVEAGVNVCLGTDSLVNLPPEAADPQRGGMSVLDEMRLLLRRDGADPLQLLRMATVNGAKALQLDTAGWRFEPGEILQGLVQAPVRAARHEGSALEAALRSSEPARLLR